MSKKEYFVVWNRDKSEGFITDDEWAAKNAHAGEQLYRERDMGQSSIGQNFGDTYRDDEEDIEKAPEIQRIEIEAGE